MEVQSFRRIFLFVFLLFFSKNLRAGIDSLEFSGSDVDYEIQYDDFTIPEKAKIEINSSLFSKFFTDSIRKKIKIHKQRNGDFLSIYELQQIEGINIELLEFLRKKGKIRHTTPFFTRLKYTPLSFRYLFQTETKFEEENRVPPFSILNNFHNFTLNFNTFFKLYFLVENDSGEGKQELYDFYSASLEMRDISIFKTIVLGNYQMTIGQGSFLWAGFQPFIYDNILSLKRNSFLLKSYTSKSEYGFLRGVAFQTKPFLKNMDIAFGISKTFQDGIIENNLVKSFDEDGYHRTELELERKRNVGDFFLLSSIGFRSEHILVRAHYAFTHYSKEISPDSTFYSIHDFRGNTVRQLGGYFDFSLGNSSLFGEYSKTIENKHAYNISFHSTPNATNTIGVSYFRESKEYFASKGISFLGDATSGGISGVYFGIKNNLTPLISGLFYFTLSEHETPRFRFIGIGQYNRQFIGRIDLKKRKKIELYLRTKYSEKNEQEKEETIKTTEQKKISLRAHSKYFINDFNFLFFRAEISKINFKEDAKSILFFFAFKTHMFRNRISNYFRITYFNAPKYENRIYAYENDLPYNFRSFSHYGKGLKFNFIARSKVSKKISLGAHFRYVLYQKRGDENNLHEHFLKFQCKISL